MWGRLGMLLVATGFYRDPPHVGPIFREVASESGVIFRFETGSRGKHDLPEIMGGGLALIDVDGDGRLDIYLCNGGPIVPSHDRLDPPCRLFRNRGDWKFQDVTDSANAPGPSYAMGTAVGDFDNDGRDDLFVSGWREQKLYRNLGGGRFADVTAQAGVDSDRWGTSAAFADLDGDGDLDLFVATYVDFDPLRTPYCAAPDGRRDFCGPEEFRAQPDLLFRNDGRGHFTEIAGSAGVAAPEGRSLGVLIADLVGDRRPDIYVANDGTAGRLWENRGRMTFVDVGLTSGLALDGSGRAPAGMGVACGDLDGDSRPELLVSNFFGRATLGFRNQGDGIFVDDSARFGLVAATRSVLGFGLGLADFDADGDLDMLQANGHVLDRARLQEPFAMRPTYLRNDHGRFVSASPLAGPWFERPIVGRGLAIGDLDGDGRPDAVVNALDAPASVLRNVGSENFPLDVHLRAGVPGSMSPVAASVRFSIAGKTQIRQVVAGGSYLATSSPSVFLGASKSWDQIKVSWPSGKTEKVVVPPGCSTLQIREGDGKQH